MITKAVIPAAGLGTRLLPATKEQPKEMLPIFSRGTNGKLCLKPFLQLVFEELYSNGFNEFCFIVGRGKRSIEDYFTVDDDFLEFLKSKNKIGFLNELTSLYEKIRNSTIVFTNQPKPLGFGNAVHYARFFTKDDVFLVHAGDDLIISHDTHLEKLNLIFERYSADVTFFVQKIEDPRKYGVIVGEKIEPKVYRVNRIIEKPPSPPSDLAVIAIYIFNSKIYQALESVGRDVNNEIQLTDAIQALINQGCKVYALELDRNERRIEVGTPESYKEAFMISLDFLKI